MTFRPLEDRIVIRPEKAEEVTPGGIVLPDTAQETPLHGEVLLVGPGRYNETRGELVPLDVKVGDKVVYSRFGGLETKIEGEDLLVLTPREILGVLE
jgi:chaperonin GroES